MQKCWPDLRARGSGDSRLRTATASNNLLTNPGSTAAVLWHRRRRTNGHFLVVRIYTSLHTVDSTTNTRPAHRFAIENHIQGWASDETSLGDNSHPRKTRACTCVFRILLSTGTRGSVCSVFRKRFWKFLQVLPHSFARDREKATERSTTRSITSFLSLSQFALSRSLSTPPNLPGALNPSCSCRVSAAGQLRAHPYSAGHLSVCLSFRTWTCHRAQVRGWSGETCSRRYSF